MNITDKMRMDWLERGGHATTVDVPRPYKFAFKMNPHGDAWRGRGRSKRQAIDRAIMAEKKARRA